MLIYDEIRPNCRASLREISLTGALSRAVTAREGRAPIEPWNAGSALSALDSIPAKIIKEVGGQDGLCEASKSSIWKSCPNLMEKRLIAIQVTNWGKSSADARREAARPQAPSARGRRLPPPPTILKGRWRFGRFTHETV